VQRLQSLGALVLATDQGRPTPGSPTTDAAAPPAELSLDSGFLPEPEDSRTEHDPSPEYSFVLSGSKRYWSLQDPHGLDLLDPCASMEALVGFVGPALASCLNLDIW